MKINLRNAPRIYSVGHANQISIQDCGQIQLEPNEQITFICSNDKEYDLCRKEWGYYATPSTNDRLKRFGFKTALVRNSRGQIYIMIVEIEKMAHFNAYLAEEANSIIKWLDEEPLDIK